jgi:hypothetical protein
MMSEKKPKLVFIVGVWRSGTSLLHSMLNHHPRMALMFEAEPFGIFPLKRDRLFPESWPKRLELFNQAISRHRLEPSQLPGREAGRDCLLAMFETWAARKNAVVMGGKSPTYHAWLPQIATIFPEADFIIIWRNPLDSCRSAVQAGKQNRFFSGHGIVWRILFGSEKLFQGVRHLRDAGRRVHELTLDDLTADPESELRKICDFVGIEFDPVMLDLQSADHSMLPPGEHHNGVRSSVVKKNQPRAEILPLQFVAKGRRYAKLWRERYAGSPFARALTEKSAEQRPGALEQFFDRIIYWFWRGWARIKTKLLRHIPLSLWKKLKKLRNQPAGDDLRKLPLPEKFEDKDRWRIETIP